MAGVTPLAPTRLSEKYECREVDRLGVNWYAPEENGAYNVMYRLYISTAETNDEDTVWTDLQPISNIVDLFFCHDTVTSHFYHYEVAAYNAIGESDLSEELILQSGDVPCPPRNVATELINRGNQVLITWDVALCDNGLEIQGYQVFIRDGARRPQFENVALDCAENTTPEDARENVVFGSCTVNMGLLYNVLGL
jgi:hypothetical protein